MIEEVKKNKETKDELKLMEAIHQNYKTTRMNRNIDRQLKKLKDKKNDKKKKAKLIIVALLVLAIFVGIGFYKENSIKSCMEDGYSEKFCRYAGE